MPRRAKQPQPSIPANALRQMCGDHLLWMRTANFSDQTVDHRRKCITQFIRWAEERGLDHPQEVTRPVLESYQRYLYYYRQKNGMPLTFRTQHSRLMPLCRWFRWMVKNNLILHNPAADLDMPRIERRVPRVIFSEREAEKILLQPDLSDPLGVRDRAILEMFYSTGMRRMELVNLKLYDVDAERGTIFIHEGKGKKDRWLPLGERAAAWTRKYLVEARPQLAAEPDDGTVFVTHLGEAFTLDFMTKLVRAYVEQADIGKTGSCHTFRHTMATLMLEGGADIRFIQQMLGHSELHSTQIYTHVAIRQLQQVHAATHPGARLYGNGNGKRPAATTSEDEQVQSGLLAALDQEAAEEE